MRSYENAETSKRWEINRKILEELAERRVGFMIKSMFSKDQPLKLNSIHIKHNVMYHRTIDPISITLYWLVSL